MRRPPDVESLNASHGSLCFFRQYLKGWNIKHVGEQAKEKDALLDKLKQLDLIADSRPLSPDEWAARYDLEDKVDLIFQMEELHWQQKSSEN